MSSRLIVNQIRHTGASADAITMDASGNVTVVRQEVIKGIKVCNENGNIEAGDYLTTSSKKGFYMKQSDDILRNYTSAKAVDDIIFDSTGEKTNVYAIMLSG